MEIDKKTIKALSADRRVEILKSLKQRRKMPSELSRELDLAPSTIVEHLNILEEAGLVLRKETGRKWIYYELTNKGESLITPKIPVQFILMLTLGFIVIFSGIANLYAVSYEFFTIPVERQIQAPAGQTPSGPGVLSVPQENATENITIIENETRVVEITNVNNFAILLILIGISLGAVGSFKISRRQS